MKLTYLSLFPLILAVQAEVSWYVGGDRNVTCKGHDDGHIKCEPGHEAGVAEVVLTYPYTRLGTFYAFPLPFHFPLLQNHTDVS